MFGPKIILPKIAKDNTTLKKSNIWLYSLLKNKTFSSIFFIKYFNFSSKYLDASLNKLMLRDGWMAEWLGDGQVEAQAVQESIAPGRCCYLKVKV